MQKQLNQCSNFQKDGFKESIVAKATTWAFAYEGNNGLTSGLRKKSLCAKKGTVIDLGGD